jgi:cyclopropane-fatty-acyl-phospholipid synthase
MALLAVGIDWTERGLLPDAITRAAIRRLCRARLATFSHKPDDAFVESLCQGPIALMPEKANNQHYELPAEFFVQVLGPQLKYSCCFWPRETNSLVDAEEAALKATCEHAQLADGQQILELGCGWGSLSLSMAERYPRSQITAISNSVSQRQFIQAAAQSRGLANLRVNTCDMNEFVPELTLGRDARFDRVVSVEMFEHMHNLELLLARIATCLKPDGSLLAHIFCHRNRCYSFEDVGDANWMGRLFFSGGMMPSANLMERFDQSFRVSQTWQWSGRHYQRTAEAWLRNLDTNRQIVLDIFRDCYRAQDAARWLQRWRMFFLAVAELFGYAGGDEWFVVHHLMQPRQSQIDTVATS